MAEVGEPSEFSSERTMGLGEPSESSSERTMGLGRQLGDAVATLRRSTRRATRAGVEPASIQPAAVELLVLVVESPGIAVSAAAAIDRRAGRARLTVSERRARPPPDQRPPRRGPS